MSESESGSDRRRHPRIPVEHLIEARLSGPDVDATGRVLDLNNAGAFVATDVQVERDTRLEVELLLPGLDTPFPLKAVVARRTEAVEGRNHTIPAGLGLVFLTDNVMERAFIQRAVLQVLKSSLAARRALPASGSAAEAGL